ncbi:hypothetical protein QTN25_001641 [Entamoeba marina]
MKTRKERTHKSFIPGRKFKTQLVQRQSKTHFTSIAYSIDGQPIFLKENNGFVGTEKDEDEEHWEHLCKVSKHLLKCEELTLSDEEKMDTAVNKLFDNLNYNSYYNKHVFKFSSIDKERSERDNTCRQSLINGYYEYKKEIDNKSIIICVCEECYKGLKKYHGQIPPKVKKNKFKKGNQFIDKKFLKQLVVKLLLLVKKKELTEGIVLLEYLLSIATIPSVAKVVGETFSEKIHPNDARYSELIKFYRLFGSGTSLLTFTLDHIVKIYPKDSSFAQRLMLLVVQTNDNCKINNLSANIHQEVFNAIVNNRKLTVQHRKLITKNLLLCLYGKAEEYFGHSIHSSFIQAFIFCVQQKRSFFVENTENVQTRLCPKYCKGKCRASSYTCNPSFTETISKHVKEWETESSQQLEEKHNLINQNMDEYFNEVVKPIYSKLVCYFEDLASLLKEMYGMDERIVCRLILHTPEENKQESIFIQFVEDLHFYDTQITFRLDRVFNFTQKMKDVLLKKSFSIYSIMFDALHTFFGKHKNISWDSFSLSQFKHIIDDLYISNPIQINSQLPLQGFDSPLAYNFYLFRFYTLVVRHYLQHNVTDALDVIRLDDVCYTSFYARILEIHRFTTALSSIFDRMENEPIPLDGFLRYFSFDVIKPLAISLCSSDIFTGNRLDTFTMHLIPQSLNTFPSTLSVPISSLLSSYSFPSNFFFSPSASSTSASLNTSLNTSCSSNTSTNTSRDVLRDVSKDVSKDVLIDVPKDKILPPLLATLKDILPTDHLLTPLSTIFSHILTILQTDNPLLSDPIQTTITSYLVAHFDYSALPHFITTPQDIDQLRNIFDRSVDSFIRYEHGAITFKDNPPLILPLTPKALLNFPTVSKTKERESFYRIINVLAETERFTHFPIINPNIPFYCTNAYQQLWLCVFSKVIGNARKDKTFREDITGNAFGFAAFVVKFPVIEQLLMKSINFQYQVNFIVSTKREFVTKSKKIITGAIKNDFLSQKILVLITRYTFALLQLISNYDQDLPAHLRLFLEIHRLHVASLLFDYCKHCSPEDGGFVVVHNKNQWATIFPYQFGPANYEDVKYQHVLHTFDNFNFGMAFVLMRLLNEINKRISSKQKSGVY